MKRYRLAAIITAEGKSEDIGEWVADALQNALDNFVPRIPEQAKLHLERIESLGSKGIDQKP